MADLTPNDGLDPGASGQTVRINRRNRFNLSPVGPPPGVPRQLRIAEGGHQTAMQALDGA